MTKPSRNPAGARPGNDLTRRKFLRGTAVTATALSYSRIAARAAGAEPSDTLNIGLVGLGDQGVKALAACMSHIPGIRFAAICDINEYKRISTKRGVIDPTRSVGTQDFAHFDDMLGAAKELDCVIVATPDWMHAPYSRKALQAGKHVYCEKMMSNTLEAAADMVKAQRETGRLLQIGHQRRSNPRYIFMRDKLLREQRLLGQITHLYGQWNRSVKIPSLPKLSAKDLESIKAAGYANPLEYANWRWYRKYGGGPISDLGAHQIDIFNWLLGTTPKSLTACGGLDYYKNLPLPDGSGTFSYEHLDNAILVYDYDVPGHGLVRVLYQVLTTSGSQNYYEKIMGVEGTIVISEQPVYNQVYREKDTTDTPEQRGRWEKLVPMGYLRKPPATVYNKFWERPKLWNRPDPWLEKEGVQDVRVSVPADPYELPKMPKHLDEKAPHQHHLENFFNTVRNNGKQTDLNCPVAEAYKCARAVLAINDAVAQQKRIEFKPEDFEVA